jgi:hypothetical protein
MEYTNTLQQQKQAKYCKNYEQMEDLINVWSLKVASKHAILVREREDGQNKMSGIRKITKFED